MRQAARGCGCIGIIGEATARGDLLGPVTGKSFNPGEHRQFFYSLNTLPSDLYLGHQITYNSYETQISGIPRIFRRTTSGWGQGYISSLQIGGPDESDDAFELSSIRI